MMSSYTLTSVNVAIEKDNDKSVDTVSEDASSKDSDNDIAPNNMDDTDARGKKQDQNDGLLSFFKPLKTKGSEKQIETALDVLISQDMCNEKEKSKCNTCTRKHTNSQIKQEPEYSTECKADNAVDDNQYDFSRAERGYAVLVVNEDFTNDLDSKRDGAQEDLRKMKAIVEKLGFKVFNEGREFNLNKNDTLDVLKRAQQTDHSNFDCFALMISTHGLDMRNARAKGRLDHALECTDNQLIFTSSILEMFNNENCPSLKDKPKLFFIQACRGDNVDHGCEMKVSYSGMVSQIHEETSTDSDLKNGTGSNEKKWCTDTCTTHSSSDSHFVPVEEQPDIKPALLKNFLRLFKKDSPDIHSLRCDNDMLVLYAIPESMYAWRSTLQGSWMINYLHAVIEDYDMKRPRSFLSLLTTVAALMAMRETSTDDAETDKKKAVSVIEHKLTKDIVFQDK